MELIPQKQWTTASHELILHGRAVCFARKPKCESCSIREHCPRVGAEKKFTTEAQSTQRKQRRE